MISTHGKVGRGAGILHHPWRGSRGYVVFTFGLPIPIKIKLVHFLYCSISRESFFLEIGQNKESVNSPYNGLTSTIVHFLSSNHYMQGSKGPPDMKGCYLQQPLIRGKTVMADSFVSPLLFPVLLSGQDRGLALAAISRSRDRIARRRYSG